MNQNPEQLARDKIDYALLRSSWIIPRHKQKNIAADLDVDIIEYLTDTSPADYILFVNRNLVGVIGTKRPYNVNRFAIIQEPDAMSIKSEGAGM